MPETSRPEEQALAINHTVKLPSALQRRIQKAMVTEGFTVWSEFCRVALTEKCQASEARQLARHSRDIN
ncbi:MAG TPA: hypothetical protein VL357_00065 [Rariglobus sp.]|jgi:hypothetical protein|nr:hypothetical protein [Rariglobus sp.]HTL69541.1 hypothetical protein [Lacunisphaera sp.]